MMQPMIPPATGPTGALLIMLRDATSSSTKEHQDERSLRVLKRAKMCKCVFVVFLIQKTPHTGKTQHDTANKLLRVFILNIKT